MPRRPQQAVPSLASALPALVGWAETLGEAMGRGMAKGFQAGLSASGGLNVVAGVSSQPRRRGRPPKVPPGMPVPPERLCRAPGCGREARSRGLCSAHYQAERRRLMKK